MSAASKARKRRQRERVRLGLPAPAAPSPRPETKPLPGPLFRRASALPVEGTKRRKLLCLLAAYADAGEISPTVKNLSRRLQLEHPGIVDALLRKLIADGWLDVQWADSVHRRNRYTLRLEREARR